MTVALAPDATGFGFIEKVDIEGTTTVTGAGFTVSITELVVVPAEFAHEIANDSVVVARVVNGPTTCVPAVATAPDQLPEAVHEVAPVVAHVRVADEPEVIEFGDTEKDDTTGAVTTTIGLGVTVSVTD